MNIELLGELTPDPRVNDWLVSDEIHVNYFPDTPLRFILEDAASDPAPTEFAAAVKNFLGLTLESRAEATPFVFKNYSDFVTLLNDGLDGEFDFVIDTPDDVWRHVQPSAIYVKRRFYGDKKIYVCITADCDWEEEHGLQIVYREGNQLSRVSDQDGHVTHSDAYALLEHEDRIC